MANTAATQDPMLLDTDMAPLKSVALAAALELVPVTEPEAELEPPEGDGADAVILPLTVALDLVDQPY